jgi:hypothetical protein
VRRYVYSVAAAAVFLVAANLWYHVGEDPDLIGILIALTVLPVVCLGAGLAETLGDGILRLTGIRRDGGSADAP